MGSQVTDKNCERLKNAKTLYDMGMKVAAVSVMCQDKRIFDAMMNAGTPCPYDGLIGEEAKIAWLSEDGNTIPEEGVEMDEGWTNDQKTMAWRWCCRSAFPLILTLRYNLDRPLMPLISVTSGLCRMYFRNKQDLRSLELSTDT